MRAVDEGPDPEPADEDPQPDAGLRPKVPLSSRAGGPAAKRWEGEWVRPHRRGLGADRLADALRRIGVASQSIGIGIGIGIGAAPVQAKDEAARRFHLRCAAFEECPAERCTLHLPIETVVAAFG